MKYKIVKIANPDHIDDMSGYKNDEYPEMVKYVGVDDYRYFLCNIDDKNDFYPYDHFLMMIDLGKFSTLELS